MVRLQARSILRLCTTATRQQFSAKQNIWTQSVAKRGRSLRSEVAAAASCGPLSYRKIAKSAICNTGLGKRQTVSSNIRIGKGKQPTALSQPSDALVWTESERLCCFSESQQFSLPNEFFDKKEALHEETSQSSCQKAAQCSGDLQLIAKPSVSSCSSGEDEQNDDESMVNSSTGQLSFEPGQRLEKTLDWSGLKDYKEGSLPLWSPDLADRGLQWALVDKDGEELLLRIKWICIHQTDDHGPALMYISDAPLDKESAKEPTTPEAEASMPAVFVRRVEGLNFRQRADQTSGDWHNFVIGMHGELSGEDHDTMWPNQPAGSEALGWLQVLHGQRVAYNLRNGGDLARFLAEPVKQDMKEHFDNLKRFQEDKEYREGWIYFRLRSQYGKKAVKEFGIMQMQEDLNEKDTRPDSSG